MVVPKLSIARSEFRVKGAPSLATLVLAHRLPDAD
jgi:hypothetical protein